MVNVTLPVDLAQRLYGLIELADERTRRIAGINPHYQRELSRAITKAVSQQQPLEHPGIAPGSRRTVR